MIHLRLLNEGEIISENVYSEMAAGYEIANEELGRNRRGSGYCNN
jgi:hypothetical protein